MPDHPYDQPGLSPLAFLQAVYSDETVPMGLRMMAADAAMPYVARAPIFEREPWPGEVKITIRIEGLGNNPPELISPEAEGERAKPQADIMSAIHDIAGRG